MVNRSPNGTCPRRIPNLGNRIMTSLAIMWFVVSLLIVGLIAIKATTYSWPRKPNPSFPRHWMNVGITIAALRIGLYLLLIFSEHRGQNTYASMLLIAFLLPEGLLVAPKSNPILVSLLLGFGSMVLSLPLTVAMRWRSWAGPLIQSLRSKG